MTRAVGSTSNWNKQDRAELSKRPVNHTVESRVRSLFTILLAHRAVLKQALRSGPRPGPWHSGTPRRALLLLLHPLERGAVDAQAGLEQLRRPRLALDAAHGDLQGVALQFVDAHPGRRLLARARQVEPLRVPVGAQGDNPLQRLLPVGSVEDVAVALDGQRGALEVLL